MFPYKLQCNRPNQSFRAVVRNSAGAEYFHFCLKAAHQPGCDALPLRRRFGPDPGNSDDDVLLPLADDVLEDANVRLVQASQRDLVGPEIVWAGNLKKGTHALSNRKKIHLSLLLQQGFFLFFWGGEGINAPSTL